MSIFARVECAKQYDINKFSIANSTSNSIFAFTGSKSTLVDAKQNTNVFDLSADISFWGNTYPVGGTIRNVPFKCAYNGSIQDNAGVLDKVYNVNTTVADPTASPKVITYHSTGSSGERSNWTRPFICIPVEADFFQNKNGPGILLFNLDGTSDAGLRRRYIYLKDYKVLSSNGILQGGFLDTAPSDTTFYKVSGAPYTELQDNINPRTCFWANDEDPFWSLGYTNQLLYIDPVLISSTIIGSEGAYFSRAPYVWYADKKPATGVGDMLVCHYGIQNLTFQDSEDNPYTPQSESVNQIYLDSTSRTRTIGDVTVTSSIESFDFYVRYIKYT